MILFLAHRTIVTMNAQTVIHISHIALHLLHIWIHSSLSTLWLITLEQYSSYCRNKNCPLYRREQRRQRTEMSGVAYNLSKQAQSNCTFFGGVLEIRNAKLWTWRHSELIMISFVARSGPFRIVHDWYKTIVASKKNTDSAPNTELEYGWKSSEENFGGAVFFF